MAGPCSAAADPSTPASDRPPWTRGRPIGQKRPLKLSEVWAIGPRLQIADRRRDLADKFNDLDAFIAHAPRDQVFAAIDPNDRDAAHR